MAVKGPNEPIDVFELTRVTPTGSLAVRMNRPRALDKVVLRFRADKSEYSPPFGRATNRGVFVSAENSREEPREPVDCTVICAFSNQTWHIDLGPSLCAPARARQRGTGRGARVRSGYLPSRAHVACDRDSCWLATYVTPLFSGPRCGSARAKLDLAQPPSLGTVRSSGARQRDTR